MEEYRFRIRNLGWNFLRERISALSVFGAYQADYLTESRFLMIMAGITANALLSLTATIT